MRKRIIKIYACIFAIGIPYYIFVTILGFGIPCPIYQLTGFLCGSCGVSRMLIALSKFQFNEAFGYNMAAFVLFFVWNIIALFAFIGKPSFFQSKRFLSICFYATVGILLVFSMLRNIF